MNEILNKLNSLSKPIEGFNVFESNDCIWGLGSNGEIVFGLTSDNSKIKPIVQATKYLKMYVNHIFICTINEVQFNKKLSLYVLYNLDAKVQELFVKLCLSMSVGLSVEILIKNFFNLKELFSSQLKPSKIELQGFYGELFTIYYLKTRFGLDISSYYQSEEKRKFDFSLTERKKIEIKTTMKPERIHHFLHLQLDTDRFDVKIVSLMLQKDDGGLSLLDLIHKCESLFSNYLSLILYIEIMVKNIDASDLDSVRFNQSYAVDRLEIYSGDKVPRVTERDVNGVFNIEYDVDFENVDAIPINSFIEWVKHN